jgi:hypothetical protein
MEGLAMPHVYKPGQLLEMRSASLYSNRRAGRCEVLFCLPHDSGPVLYRVRSFVERNERVVEEADLSPSSGDKLAAPEMPETPFSIAVTRR